MGFRERREERLLLEGDVDEEFDEGAESDPGGDGDGEEVVVGDEDDGLDNHQRLTLARARMLDGEASPSEERRLERQVRRGGGGEEDDLDRAQRIGNALHNADELEQKSALKDAKTEELAQTAPFVRTQPPSVTKGTLGGQQSVQIGGEAKQVADWPGDDFETKPVSVVFAPVQQIDLEFVTTPQGQLRPFGIIRFGTRGFSSLAEVDIGRGCRCTVPASNVMLQVALDPIAGSPPDPFKKNVQSGYVPGTMLLSGMLSFEPMVRTAPITRTRYCDPATEGAAITNGAFFEFDVPPYAKRFQVVRTPGPNENGAPPTPGGAVAIAFEDSDFNVVQDFYLVGANFDDEARDLTPDAVHLTVFSNPWLLVGQSNNNIRIIFELDI